MPAAKTKRAVRRREKSDSKNNAMNMPGQKIRRPHHGPQSAGSERE